MELVSERWSLYARRATLKVEGKTAGSMVTESHELGRWTALLAVPLSKLLFLMYKEKAANPSRQLQRLWFELRNAISQHKLRLKTGRVEESTSGQYSESFDEPAGWGPSQGYIDRAKLKVRFAEIAKILKDLAKAFAVADFAYTLSTNVFQQNAVFQPASGSDFEAMRAEWRSKRKAFVIHGAGRKLLLRADDQYWHVLEEDESSNETELGSWRRTSAWKVGDREELDGTTTAEVSAFGVGTLAVGGKRIEVPLTGGTRVRFEDATHGALWPFLVYTAQAAESLPLSVSALILVLGGGGYKLFGRFIRATRKLATGSR